MLFIDGRRYFHRVTAVVSRKELVKIPWTVVHACKRTHELSRLMIFEFSASFPSRFSEKRAFAESFYPRNVCRKGEVFGKCGLLPELCSLSQSRVLVVATLIRFEFPPMMLSSGPGNGSSRESVMHGIIVVANVSSAARTRAVLVFFVKTH